MSVSARNVRGVSTIQARAAAVEIGVGNDDFLKSIWTGETANGDSTKMAFGHSRPASNETLAARAGGVHEFPTFPASSITPRDHYRDEGARYALYLDDSVPSTSPLPHAAHDEASS